jgi:tRNA U34 5-carboxymethylaminomethyl modifying GTPase MnmE/TrmE
MAKHVSRAKRLDKASEGIQEVIGILMGLVPSTVDSSTKIQEANDALDTLDTSEFEDLRDEISEWKDNIEANFSQTQKYSDLEECHSALEEIVTCIESAQDHIEDDSDIQSRIDDLENIMNECGNVSFPGMFG